MKELCKWLSPVLGVFLLAPISMLSQITWESVAGQDQSDETGRSVIKVHQPCNPGSPGSEPKPGWATGGYIAVGTTRPGADNDVHVVRINDNGVLLWEKTYDIVSGGDDFPYSVVETPGVQGGGGFAITGKTNGNSTNGDDAFILQIDCGGQILWSATYGGTGDESGNSIIVANGGDNITTFSQDLVVAGYSSSTANGAFEGYIFRTDNSNGALRFAKTYRPSTMNNVHPVVSSGFNDIVEPRRDSIQEPFPSFQIVLGGDFFAVGWCEGCNDYLPPNDRQAFAMRVDRNGSFTVMNTHDMSEWGDLGWDEFYGVTDSMPVHFGSYNLVTFPIVAIGRYGNDKIGMVNFDGGKPSTFIASSKKRAIYLRSPIVSGVGQYDVGMDLEINPWVHMGSNIRKGDFIITGQAASTVARGGRDAFIAVLRNPFWDPTVPPNIWSVPWASRFGYENEEIGYSVEYDHVSSNQEVVMVATTNSDPLLVNDPSDMYLVRATDQLLTGCEYEYELSIEDVNLPHDLSRHPTIVNFYSPQQSSEADVDWYDLICDDEPITKPALPGEMLSRFSERGGHEVVVVNTSEELRESLARFNNKDVLIFSVHGTLVHLQQAGYHGNHSLGLPVGSYFVRIGTQGVIESMLRLVVN